mgnify:CR=1 FL=1
MCLFVHATGTTGQDARARREHVYALKCAQCGQELTATNRVAAHVVAYPAAPLNCCCGCMTLRTTCKACNSHRARRRRFWGCTPRMRRLRCLCCVPACWSYEAADASAPPSTPEKRQPESAPT